MSESIVEDICIGTIMTFCENLAELGCPKEAEPDMWFRNMSYEDQSEVVNKMFKINDRNAPPIGRVVDEMQAKTAYSDLPQDTREGLAEINAILSVGVAAVQMPQGFTSPVQTASSQMLKAYKVLQEMLCDEDNKEEG